MIKPIEFTENYMNKFITIILLFTVSSCYAIELQHAVVLDHNSGISGRDDKGRAIDGHIEEAGKEIPVFNSQKKSLTKKPKQYQLPISPTK